MFPIIFSFGPLVVYTWGVLLIVGIITAVYIFWRRAVGEGYDEEKVLDLAALAIFVGFLSSRLVWYLTHLAEFSGQVFRFFSIFSYPGFSFWGGILGVGAVSWWYSKKRRWNFWEMADFVATPVIFGQILSYFGHFLSGSAFGEPTKLFWGVRVAGFADFRHPVQVYIILLLTGLLIAVHTRSRKASKKGTLILRSLFGIATILALTSFFRSDVLILGVLKESLAINLVAASTLFFVWHRHTKRAWHQDLADIARFVKSVQPRNLIVLTRTPKMFQSLRLPKIKIGKDLKFLSPGRFRKER